MPRLAQGDRFDSREACLADCGSLSSAIFMKFSIPGV